jgi:hypothetical protein
METPRKPRKHDRISSWIRGKKSPPNPSPANPTSTQTTRGSPPRIEGDYGDRQRTNERYLEAAVLLEQAVKGRREQGDSDSYDFLEISGEPEKFDDAQFRNKINLALESRKGAIKDQTALSKCKNTVGCIFAALSPFAKNFLIIANDAQSV